MKKKSHHANQWEKRKEWRWSRRGKAEKNLEWMFTLCSKCRQIIRPISSYTGYIWWLKQQQQHTSNLLQLITLHIRWEKWKMLNACALISHTMTESVKKCIVTLTLWLQFFSFIDVDSGQIDISTALSLLFFFHFLLMIPTKEFSMLNQSGPSERFPISRWNQQLKIKIWCWVLSITHSLDHVSNWWIFLSFLQPLSRCAFVSARGVCDD